MAEKMRVQEFWNFLRFQDLRNRMEAWIKMMQGIFNKNLEDLTKLMMSNTRTKMQNSLDRVNSRVAEEEEEIT